MGDTYGAGYMTRSADEGYGERYGEAVKKVMDKKAVKEGHMQELQSGTTADRDQNADAGTATNLLLHMFSFLCPMSGFHSRTP